MFIVGNNYLFRVENTAAKSGFVYYTGEITEVKGDILSVTTIKHETITIHTKTILSSKLIKE